MNLQNNILTFSKNVSKLALYSLASSFAHLLGVFGTESAFSIWNEIFTNFLNELFDPNLKLQKINEAKFKRFKWELEQIMLNNKKNHLKKLNYCNNLVGDDKISSLPLTSHYYLYITKNYQSFILLTTFIIFFAIIKLDLYYFWRKKCFFEKHLASIKGKFAKLKYLNIDLKKVKKLVGISINEIQIGINNQILVGLYNYPINKIIFIPDTTIPYTKNQLRHINPLIRHLK